MVLKLDSQSDNFEQDFTALLALKREVSEEVDDAARAILKDVRERGDAAVIELSEKFDQVDLKTLGLRVTDAEITQAVASIPSDTMAALTLARDRIRSHHQRQLPKDDHYTDSLGVELGSRWTAIQAVGLYVPGGTASYPSSVLMNAVPAKVAGVSRIIMAVPAPKGHINPLVLAAAALAEVDEVYRIGGAQAIGALAYGTEIIAPVSKIVGPGNAFVAAAKRQVFGTVGIDMIAGPSEVLIIADATARPDFVAADLLAQCEHDVAAQGILITTSEELARDVAVEVTRQLETLPRKDIAAKSWQDNSAIIIVDTLDHAVELADRIAAEHLEIATENPDELAKKITNAGAIFLGHATPEAVGDYVGGSNHVLPTARSAKFSSGLSVLDYMKRTSILRCPSKALETLGPAAIALAEAESLDAHARSVAIRLADDGTENV
jgi:histidinol dehydrogenase